MKEYFSKLLSFRMEETSDEESDGLEVAKQKAYKRSEEEKTATNAYAKEAKNHSNERYINCKQSKAMDAKYAQRRELMNCIAFEKCEESRKDNDAWNEARYSDDFDSLSSDTTSDITDVSPQPMSPPPSSSSLMKVDAGKSPGEMKAPPHKQTTSKTVRLSHSHENTRKEEGEQSLKFLKDALNSLDCGSSVKTTSSSTGKQMYPKQKNMTFNREQMRNIDRENMILLRKIQSSRRRTTIDNNTTIHTRLASSAINRQKQQRKIEFENSILLQKIQRVKGTTNTMSGLRRF